MKRSVFLVIILIFSLNLLSQHLNWAINTTRPGGVTKMTVDPASNLYLYGYTETFQPLPIEGSTIKKFSPSGTLLFDIEWNDKIYVTDMLHDGGSHFYFCGYFKDTIHSNGIVLTSQGMRDGFIGKMDEQGQVQWTIGFGGVKDDKASALTFNADSSAIVLTGGVDSTVFLYGYPVVTTDQAIFVASFNLSGGMLSYKTYAFLPEEYGRNIGLEISCFHSGYYLLADRMGDHWSNENTPSGSVMEGRYLFHLDHNFNILWSQFVISSSCYYGYNCENMSVCNGDAYVPSFCSGKYGGSGKLERWNSLTGAPSWTLGNVDGTYYDTYAFGNRMYYVGNEEANGCPCESNTAGYARVKVQDEFNTGLVLFQKHESHFYNIAHANNGNIYVFGHTGDGDLSFGGHPLDIGYFVFSLQSPPTGIQKIQGNFPLLSIYPNPSQGNFEIVSEKNMEEVSVWSMTGSLLVQIKPDSKTCNLSDLAPGCYAVRVKSIDGYMVSKVVVAE